MTSFKTWRAGDVEREIFALLKQMLPNTKLKDFEESPSREIREIKPPRDGIAYACEYLMKMSSLDNIKVEQYWDKDGNCIGFMFQGQKYMFDKEKLSEQVRDIVGQGFRDGQNRILSKVPENSELDKFLKEFPDAELKQGIFGWSTELPKELYPDLKLPFERIRLWNKDGSPSQTHIKDMQKEM